jgi:hypothetical protein
MKMTPGDKKCLQRKILISKWTSVLKGASGGIHPLIKGMFKHLCHSDPNLMSWPTLESLGHLVIQCNNKSS